MISETADPLFNDHNGVTLGDYSLDLYIEDNAGWNGSIMTLDVVEAILVEAVQLNTKLSVDVTRLVDDWASDPVPGWKRDRIRYQRRRSGLEHLEQYHGLYGQLATNRWRSNRHSRLRLLLVLSRDGLPEQIDWFEFMITSNVDSSYPGPILFYMDNMKLTGA